MVESRRTVFAEELEAPRYSFYRKGHYFIEFLLSVTRKTGFLRSEGEWFLKKLLTLVNMINRIDF